MLLVRMIMIHKWCVLKSLRQTDCTLYLKMYKEGNQITDLEEIMCQHNSTLSIHAVAPKTSDKCWFLKYFLFSGYKDSFSKSFKLAICLNF